MADKWTELPSDNPDVKMWRTTTWNGDLDSLRGLIPADIAGNRFLKGCTFRQDSGGETVLKAEYAATPTEFTFPWWKDGKS